MRYSGSAHPWQASAVLGWRRGWIVVVAVVVIVVLAVGALAGGHLRGEATVLPVAAPAIDPRLIVRAHTVPIAGTLGSLAVQGSLYPGLPGGNTVRISLGDTGGLAPSSYLTLVVTMPGMRMVPVTATLPARDGAYSGIVPIPMFGSYAARLTLVRGGVRQHGTIQFSVPLQLGR